MASSATRGGMALRRSGQTGKGIHLLLNMPRNRSSAIKAAPRISIKRRAQSIKHQHRHRAYSASCSPHSITYRLDALANRNSIYDNGCASVSAGARKKKKNHI